MPTKPAIVKLTPREVMDVVLSNLKSIEELRQFNKDLVQLINNGARRQRAAASLQFDAGDYVQFVSRKHSEVISLRVEKVTPAGILYGIAPTGARWKVSPTICTKIDGEYFESVGMAQSALRHSAARSTQGK